jgi:type IV secretory pathway VirB2 component (pilin)
MFSSVGSPMIGAVRLSWQCYGWRRLVVLVVLWLVMLGNAHILDSVCSATVGIPGGSA